VTSPTSGTPPSVIAARAMNGGLRPTGSQGSVGSAGSAPTSRVGSLRGESPDPVPQRSASSSGASGAETNSTGKNIIVEPHAEVRAMFPDGIAKGSGRKKVRD
jgi:hypothetical protein